MSISRRSFLKMAGLITVAVAGTALFAGCTVASYLQIEFTPEVYDKLAEGSDDPDEAKKNAQALMDKINLILKAVPLVGITSIDKKTLEDALIQGIHKAVDDNEKADQICALVTIETDEDVIKAENKLYGAIVVKVGLKKDVTSKQAAVLGQAVV